MWKGVLFMFGVLLASIDSIVTLVILDGIPFCFHQCVDNSVRFLLSIEAFEMVYYWVRKSVLKQGWSRQWFVLIVLMCICFSGECLGEDY